MEAQKILERVKAAWGGGRGGKVEAVSPGDAPREFVVKTAGVFEDKATPTLLAHGLKVIAIQPTVIGTQASVTVRITDELWQKLEASEQSSIPVQSDEINDLLGDTLAALQEARELIAAKSAVIDSLNAQVKAITAAPKRIYVFAKIDNPLTVDDAVTKQRREGYQVVAESFVMGADGIPVYCAAMERPDPQLDTPVPYRMIRGSIPADAFFNTRNARLSSSDLNGGANLFERLIETDNQELEPALNELFGVVRGD